MRAVTENRLTEMRSSIQFTDYLAQDRDDDHRPEIDMTDETTPPSPASAETFGEDLGPDPFTDQPGTTNSAKHHARRVQTNGRAEAVHHRNLAQLHVAAGRHGDEQAYEEAMRRISKGQDVSPALAQRALRHQRQQGGLGLSTAELHTLGRDHDDNRRRREGRRPRS